MMTQPWKRGLAAVGLGLVAMNGHAFAQQEEAAAPAPAAARDRDAAEKDLPGPIDSLQDLQDTGKMAFKLADTNNDGQISQKEATDAGNLLVGGFFFRADANGDGVVSQEEMKQARESLARQQPLLRIILQRAKDPKKGAADGSDPAKGVASLLDGNGDKKLQATELRQAVQSSVQGLYAAADTNRDGQLSPAELNAAVIGMANAAAQAAFAAADADHNGALSQAEFDKAIQGPVNTLFRVVDANGDGQITPQEAQAAERVLMSQIKMLQVPEPGNSAKNIVEGANPKAAAPVPTFTAPRPAATPAPRQQ